MNKKLPAIMFYPGDWNKDLGVRALSFHDKGVWLEMIMLMHESEKRGYLMIGDKPITEEMLGKMLGIHLNSLRKTLRNLRDLNVCGYDEKLKTYYSRRMVKDEVFRHKSSDYGKLGGNPNFKKGKSNPYYSDKGNDKGDYNQKITPSISISNSISNKKTLMRAEHSERFEKFWTLYPCRNGKRVGKNKSKKLFDKIKPKEYEQLMIATENYSKSKNASEGYAKDPERFLRDDFWKDWLTPEREPEVKNLKRPELQSQKLSYHEPFERLVHDAIPGKK